MSIDISLVLDGCEHCGRKEEYIFDANTTHNHGEMARHASIYMHLWRAPEIGVETAGELIGPLKEAIRLMKRKPEYYRQFNPQNGWGSYEYFLLWLEGLLKACEEYPGARVEVSV